VLGQIVPTANQKLVPRQLLLKLSMLKICDTSTAEISNIKNSRCGNNKNSVKNIFY
jgi:hypothetical protein